MININIPREPNWVIPEGNYRATCTDVSPFTQKQKGKLVNQLRLVFEVHIPSNLNVQYLAQKKYEPTLATGSELRDDLANWLGREFLMQNRTLNATALIGQEADLHIKNIYNDGWLNPYVVIRAIHPPGALVCQNTRCAEIPIEPISNN